MRRRCGLAIAGSRPPIRIRGATRHASVGRSVNRCSLTRRPASSHAVPSWRKPRLCTNRTDGSPHPAGLDSRWRAGCARLRLGRRGRRRHPTGSASLSTRSCVPVGAEREKEALRGALERAAQLPLREGEASSRWRHHPQSERPDGATFSDRPTAGRYVVVELDDGAGDLPHSARWPPELAKARGTGSRRCAGGDEARARTPATTGLRARRGRARGGRGGRSGDRGLAAAAVRPDSGTAMVERSSSPRSGSCSMGSRSPERRWATRRRR